MSEVLANEHTAPMVGGSRHIVRENTAAGFRVECSLLDAQLTRLATWEHVGLDGAESRLLFELYKGLSDFAFRAVAGDHALRAHQRRIWAETPDALVVDSRPTLGWALEPSKGTAEGTADQAMYFYRTTVAAYDENSSLVVKAKDGMPLCRLNLFDFGGGAGDVDVILPNCRAGTVLAWKDGAQVLRQPVPGTVLAIDIKPKPEGAQGAPTP